MASSHGTQPANGSFLSKAFRRNPSRHCVQYCFNFQDAKRIAFNILVAEGDVNTGAEQSPRQTRGDYSPIFTSPEASNCFGIITLKIIRENEIKKGHIFERVWGFKMSVEGGSDRQQAGFLMIAAFGFPHGNETFARHLFNSSTSMFSISFVNSCCC